MVLAAVLACFVSGAARADDNAPAASLAPVVARSVERVVKIYGVGGLHGLEDYQSGMLISPDGHILTSFSYVLDTDDVRVVLADGRRFEAQLLGADPRLEVAVLKIDVNGAPAFSLAEAVEVEPGAGVLALSNLFGVATGNEPVSVQRGVVAARADLDARRGVFQTPYRGPVYVLDVVTNNPGAAGGALVTRGGELVGMLGKELRNAQNHTWLNYAVPVAELRKSVEDILAGKFVAAADEPARRPDRPLTLAMLGLELVPEVVPRTPPYVDGVRPRSPAAAAGLVPDDLVVLVGERLIQSCRALQTELELIDFEDPVKVTVLRGQELIEFTLQARQGNP